MSKQAAAVHPVVRRLDAGDVNRILEIELATYPYPWTRGIFEDCIRVGYDCWGLQLGEKLVGYSIQTQAAGENHLLNLCIAVEAQRRGYGSLLLNHAIRRARQQKCESIFLEVRPSNVAGIEIYQKYGFVNVGERPEYYRSDLGREDAIVMRLNLGSQPAVSPVF